MTWKFWQKSGVVPVATDVRFLLMKDRGVSEESAAKLRMVVEHGQYDRRSVTYFRVFDPEVVGRANVKARRYSDLDDSLILHAGHIERDGSIVLNMATHPKQTQ